MDTSRTTGQVMSKILSTQDVTQILLEKVTEMENILSIILRELDPDTSCEKYSVEPSSLVKVASDINKIEADIKTAIIHLEDIMSRIEL